MKNENKGKIILGLAAVAVFSLGTIGALSNLYDHKSDIVAYENNGVGALTQIDFNAKLASLIVPIDKDIQDIIGNGGGTGEASIDKLDVTRENQLIVNAQKDIKTSIKSINAVKTNENENSIRNQFNSSLFIINDDLNKLSDVIKNKGDLKNSFIKLETDLSKLEQLHTVSEGTDGK